mmetsp:Transcript_60843/g.145003  ORF Transcript_60843/g.145003 Transcript_60843/m.145003 type:complete len:248 (+) Transcript_60843:101-844(+)
MKCTSNSDTDAHAWEAWLSPLEPASQLPFPVKAEAQRLIFSTRTDCFDVQQLRAAVVAAQARDGSEAVVLAVRVAEAQGFCGAVLPCPWTADGVRPFGNVSTSQVFAISGGVCQAWRGEDPDDDSYDEDEGAPPPTGVMVIGSHGIAVGSSPSGTALQLAMDLRTGSTAKSAYFGNKPLAGQTSFAVDDVAVFTLGGTRGGRTSTSATESGGEADEQLHCMRGGQDAMLLNFISSSTRGGIGQHHFT